MLISAGHAPQAIVCKGWEGFMPEIKKPTITREEWIESVMRFLPNLEKQEYERMADLHHK